uniref:hypothetical protein n=1 Tax=Saccharothrix mutabilis TaxID=33921 RepID=UPI0031CE054D
MVHAGQGGEPVRCPDEFPQRRFERLAAQAVDLDALAGRPVVDGRAAQALDPHPVRHPDVHGAGAGRTAVQEQRGLPAQHGRRAGVQEDRRAAGAGVERAVPFDQHARAEPDQVGAQVDAVGHAGTEGRRTGPRTGFTRSGGW